MQRLTFANQLRGVAALSVVVSHLVGVFWGMRDFVGLASVSPVQGGQPPDIVLLVNHPWFNFGPFGVGLFFLISGLVIPFSLERHTRGTFLAARLLRIYPTYFAALLIELAVLHAGALYWQRPFPYGCWTIVTNLLLLHLLSGYPSIDLVNWTLGIEIKFYLIMCLVAPLILRGRVFVLFMLAGIILTANWALGRPQVAALVIQEQEVARQLSIDSLYMIFMFTGVLFYCHVRNLIGSAGLMVAVVAMTLLFIACWWISLIPEQFPAVTVNYLYGLGVFSIGYTLRRYARPIAILDFFAAISYPLYLVHAIIGYSLLKVLMISCHMPYGLALPVTLAAVIVLASALHYTVEEFTIGLGRKCAPVEKVRARFGHATA